MTSIMQKEMFQSRTDEYDRLLTDIAEKHEVHPDLLKQLIEYEQGRVHLKKRRGAKKDIQRIIEHSIFEVE
jgi:hypothetical protein